MRLVDYARDAAAEGMWHAAFVRSPHAHARVLSVDASALPAGAVALLPEDTAGLGRYGCQLKDQDVLANPARFVGDIVAAVAAPTPAAARAAAAAITVSYAELPPVFDPLAAVAEGAPLLHPESGDQRGRRRVDRRAAARRDERLPPLPARARRRRARLRARGRDRGGDLPHGRARSTRRWSRTPRWRAGPADGRLELTTGTQTPFNLRDDLAGVFGLDPERIRVIAPPMGGSFGAKTFTRLEAVVACLARKAGRPVKAVLDRSEEFVTLGRHPAVVRVQARRRRATGRSSPSGSTAGPTPAPTPTAGPGVASKMGYAGIGPYRIPHVRVDALAVYTNLPPNGAFRGYGATQSVWASERAMDMLAERLGMSPLELRLRNLLRDGDRFATGETMHDVHFEECLRAAADAVGYEQDPRGKGLCVLLKGMQTPSRAAIAVERTPVGYTIRSASCEMGQGVRDSLRLQGAALLGCEPGQIEVPDPDTDSSPFDTRTTSSRSTYMMGRALGAAVADLSANGGERGYGEIANEGGLDPDTGQGIASTHWHQGAAAAAVSVDEETGELTVERLHAAVYAGRVVDRAGAELQNEGSMIMGLGTALFESVEHAAGQITNANLSDYCLPALGDLPGA